MNRLQKAVKRICNAHIKNYDTPKQFYEDLQTGGCQSDLIGELVYYADTTAFYKRYKSEINELLSEWLIDLGTESPQTLFGDKWDKKDPLALETQNQNLLAWFAFEETAFNLAREEGIEI